MAIETYPYAPLLVDLPDLPTGIKLRARRVAIRILDSTDQPCSMDVELVPYARLDDGSYGNELEKSIYTRRPCQPLTVNNNRLVDTATGNILASRIAADGSWRSDADWDADEARIKADDTVVAMRQGDFFRKMMAEGLPEPIDAFSRHYILLAYRTGDLK